MAASIAFKTRVEFIKDQAFEKRRERNKKKALRRFGMIVRQQGRKNIKRGKIDRLEAVTTAGVKLTGSAAFNAILADKATALNTISFSPEPNLRTIFYGLADDNQTILIGPVGFSGGNPTVPEAIEAERPFMGPALESRYEELAKSIEKFGLV